MVKVAKDNIFIVLKNRILSGELSSDAPLKERDLAEEFGISRTPVREALRQLVSEKLVRIVPNVGAFVGSFSWKDATEIFAVRKVLEAFAAQLTTPRLTAVQIAGLEKVLKKSAVLRHWYGQQRLRSFAILSDSAPLRTKPEHLRYR